MIPDLHAQPAVENGPARIVGPERAENEQTSSPAQLDTVDLSGFDDPWWSGNSSGAYTEEAGAQEFEDLEFSFDDGLISMLDDGQVPQQLPNEDILNSLDSDEADLRRNLGSLLTQLQLEGDRMEDRRPLDARVGEGEAEDATYFDPLAQYRNPAAEAPQPFPLTDPNNANSSPVTCTFGTMKDGNLSFVSQDFRWFEASHFPDALISQAEASVGLVYLTITNWQPWFLGHLKSAIPNFPVQPVLHLIDDNATTMLPLMDRYLSEMSCVTEHIDIDTQPRTVGNEGLSIGTSRTLSRPLVVWTAARDGLQHHRHRPLVVVVSRSSNNIVSKIAGHYMQVKNGQVSHVRWERMRGNQTWVYLDLCNIFTKWDKIWGAVKNNLNAKVAGIHNRRLEESIHERTRQLHIDNIVMINLREQLRTHRASLNVVIQRTREPSELQYWQSSEILTARLDDALQLLEYYDLTATSLLEQQQNLISLVSTLENVSQGQTVTRLNTLALVFLPLSFVASVFGINTLTVSPKYFPAAALPVLLLTIGVAYLAKKIISSDQTSQSFSSQRRLKDIEKFPSSRSVSTFNYPDVQGGRRSWNVAPRNLFRSFLAQRRGQQSRSRTSRLKAAQTVNISTPPPTIPVSQLALQTSFQSARRPSPPNESAPRGGPPFSFPARSRPSSAIGEAISRGGPAFSSPSTSANPISPIIPIPNPLWPPTTFPNFDTFDSPTSSSRHAFDPHPIPPPRTSSRRQLSPNISIRKSTPIHQARAPLPPPEEEDTVDIPTSPHVIEAIENTFRPVSRQHIGYQIAESVGADTGEQRIIATGMSDITEDSDQGGGGERRPDAETERSSSDLSSEGQIDYEDVERRQAEVDDFDQSQVQLKNSPSRPEGYAANQGFSSEIIFGESFGDQKLVLEALHASGYVERLVSQFEGVGEAIASRQTALELYDADEYEREAQEDPAAQGPGIYDANAYQQEIMRDGEGGFVDVELYDAEEDNYHRGGEYQAPTETPSHAAQGQITPPPPPPPRSPSRSPTNPNLTSSQTATQLLPQFSSDTRASSSSPPQGKEEEHTSLQSSASTSSNETAVTARSRPLVASVVSESEAEAEDSLYDSHGFYNSPAPRRRERVPEVEGDEHAEHPGGLRKERVLSLLENEPRDIEVSTSQPVRPSQENPSAIHDTELTLARQASETHTKTETDGARTSNEYVEEEDEEAEGERTSSEMGGDSESGDESGAESMIEVERATRLLATIGLEGQRASVASGGSYTRGYLDTIPE